MTVRRRLAALVACSLTATLLPFSALAESGIPAGSGAVITAGQPILVRVAPGWDAAVSYQIADGSSVTIGGAAQAASDGSMWYPVDGGFVPVDSVTSVATLNGGLQLYQDASTTDGAQPVAQDAVDPSASQTGWVDPNTGQWVDPNATQTGWVDPNTGQWVDPSATQTQNGWIDPNTGQWVDASTAQGGGADPATTETGWVDPNTGQWVDPATTETGWVDPNTGEWVDPSTAQSQTGWVDPDTGQWVNGVALAQEVPADDAAAAPASDEWVDPATDTSAEAAPLATDTTGAADASTDAAPADGGADPATDGWTDPNAAPADAAPADDGWVAPAPANTTASGDSWSEPVGTAYIAGTNGDGVACRAAAQRGSQKLAVLGEGESVEVRGDAVNGWQPVNCAGIGGYVNTQFISWQPPAAPSGGGKRSRGGGGGSGDPAGQEMVQVAMQYVGYPYAYAGEGPYAFDCSGFTKFVAENALGIDITHDMFTQKGMGQSVSKDQLQPGDLVFFANTFRPGLSHVGIYVGNGQFVHAENESTGVIVSDLNNDYYGSRWAGGTRLA
jgi:cell wall-associated NlpC family hydrolase